jgi:hypothetical protein
MLLTIFHYFGEDLRVMKQAPSSAVRLRDILVGRYRNNVEHSGFDEDMPA